MTKTAGYEKEVDLCTDFVACLPEGWIAYAETAGFDLLLVRKEDGFQIGVEAKLRLNAKVIAQVLEGGGYWSSDLPQPDCRAVLIPSRCGDGLEKVCEALGITIIRLVEARRDEKGEIVWSKYIPSYIETPDHGSTMPLRPPLPKLSDGAWGEDWFERCPAKRCELPDYVPDVVAGDKAPVALTLWKIRAIKLAVLLDKRGYITRKDFKHFKVSISRWVDPYSGWLVKDGQGGWVAGTDFPDFKAQHPVNYIEIEADFEKWAPDATTAEPGLFSGKGETV